MQRELRRKIPWERHPGSDGVELRKLKGRKPEWLYPSFGSEILGETCDRKRKSVICIQISGSRYFRKSAETGALA